MNIIDERNVRTIHRKLRKKEYDERMTLAVPEDVQTGDRVRLLDEGFVVDADGRPVFYIKKRVLSEFVQSLPDDYVGSINLGHMDFATFPILLGSWTKADLHLVDIGEGRQALDVDLHLDEENILVKELRRANYTLGVSAEFSFHRDERNSKKYDIEILDKIYIHAFAIVGEAGNVNSSGIRLGGSMTTKEFMDAINSANPTDLAEINKRLSALMGEDEMPAEPEKEAEASAEPEKEAEAEAPAEPEKEEAEKDESAAEPEKEAEESEPETEQRDEEAALSTVMLAVNELIRSNSELVEENKRLRGMLDARDKEEKEFVKKFKSLSIGLPTGQSMDEMPETENAVYTDGIGE